MAGSFRERRERSLEVRERGGKVVGRGREGLWREEWQVAQEGGQEQWQAPPRHLQAAQKTQKQGRNEAEGGPEKAGKGRGA